MTDAQPNAAMVEWVQWAADRVRTLRPRIQLEPEEFLASAWWGQRWIEDYTELSKAEHGYGEEALIKTINQSMSSSMARSHGFPRYPTGAPCLRSVIVAQDVFCMAFGDEEKQLREILCRDVERRSNVLGQMISQLDSLYIHEFK